MNLLSFPTLFPINYCSAWFKCFKLIIIFHLHGYEVFFSSIVQNPLFPYGIFTAHAKSSMFQVFSISPYLSYQNEVK